MTVTEQLVHRRDLLRMAKLGNRLETDRLLGHNTFPPVPLHGNDGARLDFFVLKNLLIPDARHCHHCCASVLFSGSSLIWSVSTSQSLAPVSRMNWLSSMHWHHKKTG